MEHQRNPFAEPLLIAFLADLLATLALVALVIFRLNSPGQKDVAEIGLYGTLFGTFIATLSAIAQALSRDPATARMNAQAAVVNAGTLAAATPPAAPPLAGPPAPVAVTVTNTEENAVPVTPQEPP